MIHCIAAYEVPRFDSEEGGFELWLAGDNQRGSKGYVPEAWEEFKRQFLASKRKKAFLGMGDYCDFLRPSLRPMLKGALGKDDSARRMLDKAIMKQHDETIRDMEFLKGYTLGLHEGHHNWTTLDGINLDQRLSSALGARFLGFAATTRLVLRGSYGGKISVNQLGYPKNSHVVTLLTTHGNASGRKVPGALSWAENNLASAFIADIYAIGHGCKGGNDAPFERTEVKRAGGAGLRRTVPRILAVGGFCRGWTDGWESDYVEQAGLTPQPLSWAKIHFRIVERRDVELARGRPGRGTKTLEIQAMNIYYTEPEKGS